MVIAFTFLIWMLSDLFIDFLNKKQKQREEEEKQRHDCNFCYFYKDGKCQTQYEEDCKTRNYFIWYPKEKNK